VTNSDTFPLWIAGWKALLIEAGQDAFSLLDQRTEAMRNAQAVCCSIAPTGPNSLDAIAKRVGFAPEVGICSIDIDSCDYWIFARMEMRPAVVIIECNPDFPILVPYHDPEGAPSLLRHSARAVAELGTEMGYRAIACTGPNVILMREDVIATNPTAVPNLPLYALEDKAYAASRSRWIIGAKPFSYRPIYKQRPTPMHRAYFWARAAGLSARALIRGRGGSLADVGPTYRQHLTQHGLYL
jgi:hypothetical protein